MVSTQNIINDGKYTSFCIDDVLCIGGIFSTSDTTETTSTTSGSIVTSGGIGVGKSIYVGEDITVIDDVTVGNNLSVTGDIEVFGNFIMDHGTVTQLTNLTTDVDIDNPTGIITTVSASTSAQSTESFTVTNSSVSSTSVITVNICNYSGTYGTNGLPSVNINNITDGSFDLIITNNHDTNSLSGILNISFIIV